MRSPGGQVQTIRDVAVEQVVTDRGQGQCRKVGIRAADEPGADAQSDLRLTFGDGSIHSPANQRVIPERLPLIRSLVLTQGVGVIGSNPGAG